MFYLKVWVGVGVGQPGWSGVLLVLEGPVKNLRYGTEIEGTHSGCRDTVPECREQNRWGGWWATEKRERALEKRDWTTGNETMSHSEANICVRNGTLLTAASNRTQNVMKPSSLSDYTFRNSTQLRRSARLINGADGLRPEIQLWLFKLSVSTSTSLLPLLRK